MWGNCVLGSFVRYFGSYLAFLLSCGDYTRFVWLSLSDCWYVGLDVLIWICVYVRFPVVVLLFCCRGTLWTRTSRKSLKRLAQETGVSESSARTATQLLKPSSESLCAVSSRKIDVPVFFNETFNYEKYLCVERTAFSTPPVIYEFKLLHSERYRPSGMLIHRQNSYALPSKLRTGRREAQSSGPGPHRKIPSCTSLIRTVVYY
jgi:hypothetical protein